ncbi:Mbov_0395 family pilin-like conjugal transfer protein [Candidatus Nanosyncoccus alces]|uniref:DUF4190 domain-containing protein n=1 Tax=Candidatus Nanosyncoccus alces TaxID=2171997 RepID=A0ABY0FMD9_9BACT|nr:pilin [Candidatus Nanosyncoccus alces]RYC74935.1 hypothetical protein G3RUM_00211 [Candidatus Nanosyncoccus alces]
MKDLITKFAEIGVELKPVTEEDTLKDNVTTILSTIIGVLGFVCVVVMIIGGVNYMTSSGDAGKVKKAKDTILYGLIGLIVCVLAFALVQFVINTILEN